MNTIKHLKKGMESKDWMLLGIGIIVLFPVFMPSDYQLHLFFNGLLFLSVLIFLFKKKQKHLFEPIYIFSLYYISVPTVIWYYILTDFENNPFVHAVDYTNDFNTLFLISVFFFFIGYLFCILGYMKIHKKDLECKIEFEKEQKISNLSCLLLGLPLVIVGIINFLFNLFKFANGDFFYYIFSMSNRSNEFANGGTTLGYTFASIGVFVLLFLTLRSNKKKYYIYFFISLFTVFIMRLSTGRIFSSISFVGIVISIYYFYKISVEGKINNRPFLLIGCSILFIGVFAYFLRMIGGLEVNNQQIHSISSYFSGFISKFGYYAIDKGNLPNIALLPKLIDSWSKDVGYLYGSSFITWVFAFLPHGIRPSMVMPAVIAKKTWFAQVSSGNLPVTFIGELYVNFGWVGPILGMFVFGILITVLFNYTLKKKNYWIYVITMQITIGFIALSPKGESNNLSLWMILPYISSYLFLVIMTKIQNKYQDLFLSYFSKIRNGRKKDL